MSNAAGRRAALVRARARRVALDWDRAARDRRIEVRTADVLVLLHERDAARQTVLDVELELGRALQKLAAEDLTPPSLAHCCELPLAEVRRLCRLAPATGAASPTTRRAATPGSPDNPDVGPAEFDEARQQPDSDHAGLAPAPAEPGPAPAPAPAPADSAEPLARSQTRAPRLPDGAASRPAPWPSGNSV